MPSAASVTAKRTAGPGGESHSARPFVSALAARGGLGTSTHLCLLTKWSWKAWDLLVWLVDTALPVALPTSPARTWWTVWFLLLVLYSAVDVPLHIAFESWRRLQPVTCLSWLCCVTFCVDIIVRFRTSHVTSQGEVIRTPRLVALNYLRGMFLLDLVSALPLDEIIDLLLGGQGHHNAYWVGLLRIPRLFITMRQLNRIIPVKYYNLANVAKLLGAMLLSTHWAACMWYYLAFDEVRGNWPWIFTAGGCSGCSSDLGRYLFAFYRCFLILLGDRPQAYNNVERIFVLVLLLLGACLYAVIMGSMTLLVSNMWSMASRHKQRAAMLQDALRYNGASAGTDLRSRVDQYFDFMATHEHPGAEGLALLSELPTALHSELMSTVFEPLLTRVQLFAYCERAFVWRLAQRLRLATFMPKDILYGVNSVGHDMYIIWRGNVALTEPDGCMTALLCEGDHFGELGVMAANTPRPQRAVALCAADVLILSRGDIQDAMRDFPDSAQLVKSRARVQLEDHEIGPAVWAATMAMCKDMKEAGDDSSDVPSPPSCSAERPKSALPQAPNPHSSVLGTDGSGGTSSTDNMAASSAQKSPWPRPDVICRRRQEGAPAASFWRRQYLLGQVQGDAAEGRAASPGPVAEAMETGADGSQHVGATSLTSMGGTALDSRDVDSRRRPSSLSSEDSFLEALGLKAEAAAGPGDGGAPVGVQGAWAAGDKPSAAPSTPRWKPPRLPARVSRRAGCPTSALVLEELLVEPRQSVMGSNPTLGEPGPVQQRTQHDAGVVPQANRNMLGDDVGSLRGGSRAATATSHAGLQFWMASVQPCSATSGTPLKQQQHQQQSSHPTANLCGFDPRELAALERVRATSTRPVDPGGVIRYLSKRARQEAGAAAVPSSGPFAAAGAAPGNPSGGGPGPQVAATCLSAAPTGEDSSCWRGVTQEFDVHDLVEVPSSSAGQQSPPTAPQLLFMTPQPFLGADPLGPLFDQPAPALGGVSSMLGLRWRGRSPRLTTVTGDGTLPSAPFGGTEDSRTRQLVAPVCRRSIRSVLRGSGRRVSGSSLGKYASAGSSERGIDEWLNDQQQATCHQPRCAELEQQVSQLRRQLAAAHARLETILEDPLKAEPSIQALVQQKVQAAVAALSTRTEELLKHLLEGLLGVSARTEDLSQQVSAADERLKHLEDTHAGDFGAAVAGTAMTVGLRLPPLVAAAAAADGGGGGVLVDAPIKGPAEHQGRNVAAPLAGLLRPSTATASQMGALLPLSTSSVRASLGRQSSLRQMSVHQRRSSTLSFKSTPWEDVMAEAGVAGAPSDAALLGTITSLPVPDTALFAATMNRAAGKNVRRRQSARDLSVLTSSTIAAQQQQQELREQQSVFQQALETTSNSIDPAASSELPRANSRADGVRPVKQRSSMLFGMVFQSGERLSPTGTQALRRGIGRKSSRALVNGEDSPLLPQAASNASTATGGVATGGGAATNYTSSRCTSRSSSGQPDTEAGTSEITPAGQEERAPKTSSPLQEGTSSG